MLNQGPHTSISITSGTIIRFVSILILFYVFFLIRDVLMVILTAIVLASAVEPGTRWFVQRRIPRVPAVLLIYLGTAAVFVGSFYFFLVPLIGDFSDVLKTMPTSSALIPAENTNSFLGGLSNSFSLPAVMDSLNVVGQKLASGFFGTVDLAFGGILSFLLIIVLSFYLAVQEDGVGKFLRIIAPAQYEPYIIDLWKRSKEKIGLWMQGQVLLAIIVAVLVFLGLTLIGVKQALLLAFLAGIFEIIPIFGAFLAAAPAILIAFMDKGFTFALIVAGLFTIIQQFESQLIYPMVVKKVVGVPPIISILALVIGAKLAGFLGIILSVPLAAVLIELLNDFEKQKSKRSSS